MGLQSRVRRQGATATFAPAGARVLIPAVTVWPGALLFACLIPQLHQHCSGCPAPWGCEWWVSVLQRPPEGSALSPAVWSLRAVTPQPHHRGCWHPSLQLALAVPQPAELGLGAELCLCVLLGRRRGWGAALREMLRVWHCCSALLPTFPEALQQPARGVSWRNHVSPVQAQFSSACSDSRGTCKCPGAAGCWDVGPTPDTLPCNKETRLQA